MVCAEKKTGGVSLREGLPRRLISHVLTLLCLSLCLACLAGCKENPVIEVVEFPQSFADLVDKVQPAVVNISTTTTVRVPGNPFQHFFGQNPHDPFGDFYDALRQREKGKSLLLLIKGSGSAVYLLF